jgi:hypothetical protein
MAVPLHVRVLEWFADASGGQLPQIRAVPKGQRRRTVAVWWETPMPGYMRAGIAVASLAIAVAATLLLAALLFGAYVLLS